MNCKYKLSPSKSTMYLRCSASLRHVLPFKETEVTKRGKLLHEIACKMLYNTKKEEIERTCLENKLNEYELNLIVSYVNYVQSVYSDSVKDGIVKYIVEDKTNVTIYGLNIYMVFDVAIICKKTATIIDLKTGRNDVDVEGNEQLLFYAFKVFSEFPEVETIKNVIFQKMHSKEVVLTRAEVENFFLNQFDQFFDIINDDLKYVPSEKGCKYCDYKDKCVAHSERVLKGKQ